jgi:hypothetical protein
MNADRQTQTAQSAAERYSLVLGALSTIFTQALQGSEPGSPRTQKKVLAAAYQIAQTYINQETDQVFQAIEYEKNDAVRETLKDLNFEQREPDDAVNTHTEALSADLEKSLRVQLERDVASMLRGLRDMSLRASLKARASGISHRAALVALRQAGNSAPQFIYVDRASRNWSSEKYVKTVWRQILVLAWNESALLTMADWVDQAVINHPDAKHANQGDLISLKENTEGETWDTVKDTVFHPNSQVWITPHIASA